MKKILPLFIAFSFCLTGCVSQDNTNSTDINNPYEISVNGEILSYNSRDNVDTKIFNIGGSATDVIPNEEENIIVINDDGKIRCISVVDNKIVTYNNISVGDPVNKIEEAYEYEYKVDNNYMVIFNNGIEEDPMNQDKEDDWLWINYITDEKNITRIQIYDYKYGKVLH